MPVRGDSSDLSALRSALRRAGFRTRRVATAMGAGGQDLVPSPAQVPAMLRTLPGGPLGTLIRGFIVGVPVPLGDLEVAFSPLPVERAAAMGLVAVDGDMVRPLVRLVPAGDVVVACDLTPDLARVAEDVVPGVAGSSWALAHLTVRHQVETALDLGTGCGFQALLAAAHAGHVTATDNNPRALAFARFSAALNGLSNVEFVAGDLFEPVAGRRFDLVVANPPFVVSPDDEYLYRDSAHPRDELSREVVQAAAAALNPGGFACVVVGWVHQPGEEWWTPLADWIDGLRCDAWLLHFTTDDAVEYATNWNAPLQWDAARHEAAVARWLDYFARERIEAIAYGAVILRRRVAGEPWVRGRSLGRAPAATANGHVVDLFAARDLLDSRELLDERLVFDVPHRLEHVLRVRDGRFHVERSLLHMDTGLRFQAAVDDLTPDLLLHLDGTRTLAEAIREVGAMPERAVEVAAEMVELGFVHPAEGGSGGADP